MQITSTSPFEPGSGMLLRAPLRPGGSAAAPGAARGRTLRGGRPAGARHVAGARPGGVASVQQTALVLDHDAARMRTIEAVRVLADRGARPELLDVFGRDGAERIPLA